MSLMKWRPTRPLRFTIFSLLTVCGIALATTFGPLYVAAAGRDYVNTTFEMDSEVEYQAAQKLAQLYLSKVLNSPAAIKKAIESDYVRVVYADQQIVDFKIKRWPSSIPMDFSQKVSSSGYKHLSAKLEAMLNSPCAFASNGAGALTFDTGYWGSSSSVSDGSDGFASGTVVVTGYWVNTGPLTVYPAGQGNPLRVCR